MRLISLKLDVELSVATGDIKNVSNLREKYLQLAGTFVATLAVDISLDGGNNWFAAATGLNAAGLTSIPQPATHMRVRTTAYTSGTPLLFLAGWDDNG